MYHLESERENAESFQNDSEDDSHGEQQATKR